MFYITNTKKANRQKNTPPKNEEKLNQKYLSLWFM